MDYDRCLKFRSLGAFVAILSVVGLSGCGPGETDAVFTGGAATDNPLDGGVLNDDGKDFTLTTDGATLSKVAISGGAEIGFDRGRTESSSVWFQPGGVGALDYRDLFRTYSDWLVHGRCSAD